MADRICSIIGCDRKARSRGWCSAHYMRWSRLGDPTAGAPLNRVGDKKTCVVTDCGREVVARGWCSQHYDRWKRHGDPEGSASPQPPEQRFWSLVHMMGPCWVWQGHMNAYGYGRFGYDNREVFAHRYSYELAYGLITPGCDIDHVCHNTACVRPEHLRVVTHKQNLEHRRGANANSSTGVRGVSQTRSGRWNARVKHYGIAVNLGNFRTLEEAEAAVIARRNELFTHNDMDRTQ